MTIEGKEIATATPQGSRFKSSEWRATELNRTLALCRPIGMSDDMASDWLAAALVEVRDFSDAQLAGACERARRECTHFSQVIPFLFKNQPQTDTMADSFLREWKRGVKALSDAPKLENKSEAQKLIESTAKGLKA